MCFTLCVKQNFIIPQNVTSHSSIILLHSPRLQICFNFNTHNTSIHILCTKCKCSSMHLCYIYSPIQIPQHPGTPTACTHHPNNNTLVHYSLCYPFLHTACSTYPSCCGGRCSDTSITSS